MAKIVPYLGVSQWLVGQLSGKDYPDLPVN